MRNDSTYLLNGYYQCLQGIAYDSVPVRVYQLSVDKDERYHHIQLRMESETDASNRSQFVTTPIVIVEIITVHDRGIDASIVEDIDAQVRALIFPTRRTLGISMPEESQLLNVRIESVTYLDEFDAARYRHRKILRFTNRINQLNLTT
jgi:hypothetical protein